MFGNSPYQASETVIKPVACPSTLGQRALALRNWWDLDHCRSTSLAVSKCAPSFLEPGAFFLDGNHRFFMAPAASSQPITKRGAILFLLTLATILCIVALPQYLQFKKSAQWPTTSGTITLSRIRFQPRGPWPFGKRFEGYLGDVQYRYHVGATDYLGSRLSFEPTHLSAAEAWYSTIRSYPVGKTVTVYYDSRNPASAVLEPGLVGDLAWLYKTDLFFIAAFATSLLIALYKFR